MQKQDRPPARVADLFPIHHMPVGERQVAGLEGPDFGKKIAARHGASVKHSGGSNIQKFFGSFFQKRTAFLGS
jgi:hypothetical protein